MCGIFGYVGKKNQVDLALTGLQRLEYRGYDSAGIGGVSAGQIIVCKEMGKVSGLRKKVEQEGVVLDIVIAHTRWATHGAPSMQNAHPQTDQNNTLAIVHNGIIENHEQLRNQLQRKGVQFSSETDTEVAAQLIASLYEGDLLKAVQEAAALLKGSYAFAIVHSKHPGQIIAVAHESPLAVGIGEGEAFISSDPHAFADQTSDVIYLTDGEIANVTADKIEIYNIHNHLIEKKMQKLESSGMEISKGSFEHFTLKEIFEQPQALRNGMLSRFVQDWGTAQFEEIQSIIDQLHGIERIVIVACGTSWHAGMIGALMIEEMARIPVQVEISSEFRYKNPIIPHGTLALAISQSGETADTLAAVRELRAKGVHVIGICNAHGSSLVRESDGTLFLRAGPEIGVCSTKAFTNMCLVLALFSLMLARMRHMDKVEGEKFLAKIIALPNQVQKVLDQAPQIEAVAKKYASYENFFFLGRQYMYPTALEGALKLKEISYINANGYPAGEMKHGPIALISPDCPTVALCANKATFDKMLSNLMEVRARKRIVLAIASENSPDVERICEHVIWIPETDDSLSPILATIATQLFAYYVAHERGLEIDQPRNLAKSVTVE